MGCGYEWATKDDSMDLRLFNTLPRCMSIRLFHTPPRCMSIRLFHTLPRCMSIRLFHTLPRCMSLRVLFDFCCILCISIDLVEFYTF